MKELSKKVPELSDFPPRLRRIAEIMINSIEFSSLKKACELANVNYDSAKTMIARYRRKGIDFNEFVSSKVIELLRKGRYDVYRSLRNRAIEGSGFHQKLFSQLVGDYIDKQEIKHDIGLTFVFTAQEIPEDLRQTREKEKEVEKVIDTTAEQIK